MKYSEMPKVQSGLRFRSASGLIVETTGHTFHVESNKLYVHEVLVLEGVGKGEKFLHNLDAAQPLEAPSVP